MNWKNALKILIALVLFILMQNIWLFGIAATSGYLSDIMTFCHLYPEKMALALILSGGTTTLLIYMMGMIRCPETFYWNGLNWKYALLGIVASFTAIIASDMLSELMNLPDLMQVQFESMAESLWGILAIAVIGPIVEEILFREGIQGYMTRMGIAPWKAILMSSLLFGIIHMNPAQIPFAFLIGLCLSLIYQKTQSITLTSLIHILNNSLAAMQLNLLGERIKEFKIADILGLNTFGLCVTIIVLFSTSALLFRMFWKSETSLRR